MRSILFFALLIIGFNNQVFSQVEKGAKIEFKKVIHDYGNVKFGGDGTSTFIFVNTGNEPLVIAQAKQTCGCTVPEWPREPIAPGEKGTITVKYDTKRAGAIAKSVFIISNATNDPNKELRIKGMVLPAQ
jgi:hypothetical protein